ncbi:MAG: hypothetical protein Q9157_002078 [Trypethelium eluteriae]
MTLQDASQQMPVELRSLSEDQIFCVANPTEEATSIYSRSASQAPSVSDRSITEPINASPTAAEKAGQPKEKWRLNVLVLGLCVSLLLSTLETTIVSTALVSITNELNGFAQRDWIVTSYLLTYTGFLTIYAKFSDIFGRNGPVGAVAMLLLVIFLPATAADTAMFMLIRKRVHNHAWHRVDFIGAFLLLSASVLLVFVLEEAGARFAWDSAAMISSLVCACICWILFPLWEHYVDRPQSTQEPVFPIRLLKDRMISGMMLYAFFTGFPFMVVIVNLPQRFQAINAVSPLLAGVYLMPLLLCSPLASGLSGYLVSNLKIPPFYLIVAGSILQLVGVCLLGSLPSVPLHLEKQQFGYEVIMGLGFGIGLSTILIMTPLVVEDKDMAVTMGALTRIRVLGGTLGLAICSSIFNNHVSSKLRNIIDPVELSKISDSASNINSLKEPQRNQIRVTFADAYSLQMHVVAAFSGLVFLVSFLMWERHPRKVEDRNLE